MVLSLIMGGALVEQVCLTKWTATHEAAKVNASASLAAIQHERNQSSAFSTRLLPHHLSFPLRFLASHQVGCAAITMLLLRNGAKVTSRDGHGVTPLGVAAEYGNTEALDILVQHGKTPRLYVQCAML